MRIELKTQIALESDLMHHLWNPNLFVSFILYEHYEIGSCLLDTVIIMMEIINRIRMMSYYPDLGSLPVLFI